MVVRSEKTILLMIGSAKNRRNKIPDNYKPSIELEGEKVKLSTSEKLLGIVINDTMEWNHHIYGNEEELGLLRTLSKRIGILSKIRKFVEPKRFTSFYNSIFISKLSYGITAWGSVSGIPGRREEARAGLTKRDLQRIQSLQNEASCLFHNRDKYFPA